MQQQYINGGMLHTCVANAVEVMPQTAKMAASSWPKITTFQVRQRLIVSTLDLVISLQTAWRGRVVEFLCRSSSYHANAAKLTRNRANRRWAHVA